LDILPSGSKIYYDRLMEIPLSIRERGRRLVASPPAAYRAACAASLAIILTALAVNGSEPGILGWALACLAAIAALFDETWIFDPAADRISHRSGVLPFVARKRFSISDVERVRVVPFVRGTIPGSSDENLENAAALSGGRGDDLGRRRLSFKRPYLCIVLETRDGSRYFVDACSSRKSAAVKAKAARIAAFIRVPLAEG
jgi:hypothetical protein